MATPYQSGKLPSAQRTRDEYLTAEKTIAAQFTDGEFEFLSIQFSPYSFPTCRTKRGDTIQQWQINGEGLENWTVGAMEWSKTQDQIEKSVTITRLDLSDIFGDIAFLFTVAVVTFLILQYLK